MRRSSDLMLVAALALVCALICRFVPADAELIRVLPAALLLLVLPGYALTAVLLAPSQVTTLERLLLTIALSMVAGVLVALALDVSWHLETRSWAFALALFTMLAALLAWQRGHERVLRAPRAPRIGLPAALALGGAVLLGGGAVALGVTTLRAPDQAQGTTALWISPRSDNAVAVGVHSVELRPRSYELDVRVAGQRGRRIGPFTLRPGQQRRLLLPAPAGPNGMPIVEVLLRRPGGRRPPLRRVALRAGRRSVVFPGPPRPLCPRSHPLRSVNGCYRIVVRGTQRLRSYRNGRRVVVA